MTNEQNKPQSDAKNPDKNPDMDGNQGEGNRREAKAYNGATTDFAKSGEVEEQAQKARRDLEGEAGDELRRAEEEAKNHSKGEYPARHKG